MTDSAELDRLLAEFFPDRKKPEDVEREMGIRHADGETWWYHAPLPRRWHRCTPWTTGPTVHRCSCGALRFVDDHVWIQRNSRRKDR